MAMRREGKILVVEDNPVICREIESQFNCDCATDGWDAIEKLETSDYAAIVIDADVPRHSGYGVLTYLREENGEEQASESDRRRPHRPGAADRPGGDQRRQEGGDARLC